MGIFRELVKNAMPHYLVEKYQHNSGNPFAFGSFYSPIPSKDEINKFNFNAPLPKTIPGVDLNSNEQLQLLDLLERFYKELPFPDKKQLVLDIIMKIKSILTQMQYFYIV